MVVMGTMVYQTHGLSALSIVELAVVVSTPLFAISTFASGGILRANESAPRWSPGVHRAASLGTGVFAAGIVFLTAGRG